MINYQKIKVLFTLFCLLFTIVIFADETNHYKLNLSSKAQTKIGGLLLKNTLSKRFAIAAMKKGKVLQQKPFGKLDKEIIAVYLTRKPTKLFDEKLEALGINRKNKYWIPAVANHKYGFAIYIAPIDKIETLAKMPEIMRIASAEQTFGAQLDKVPVRVGLNPVEKTCTGGGITVGIIDTGYDVGNPDLPEPVAKWAYPDGILNTNADVSDYTSGHGTYIAGCIVGSGYLSEESGSYLNIMGISTGVQVHVVKANTTNSYGIDIFREDILVQALMDLAANNCVDMINLSLGAWGTYHDGSSLLEQTIDNLAVNYDMPVFCAAGNLADKKRHVTLKIHSFEEQIILLKVITTNKEEFTIGLNFVSADGNSLNTEVLDISRWEKPTQFSTGDEWIRKASDFPPTISLKGIVRQRYQVQAHSFYDKDNGGELPSKEIEWTFGFYITNKLSSDRFLHLYIDSFERPTVNAKFQSADSKYTVTAPGNADKAFTVGATVSRQTYNSISNPVNPSVSTIIGAVAPFSGRGPRVDLDPIGELMPYDGTLEGVGADYRFKPDFVVPGQFIFSLFDSNVRSNYLPVESYTDLKFNTPPPAYCLSPAGTSAWHLSLPYCASSQRSFFTNDISDNHILNYWCPQDALGNANISSEGSAGTSPRRLPLLVLVVLLLF